MQIDNQSMQFLNKAIEIVIVFEDNGKVIFANSTALKLLEYEDITQNINISDIFPTAFECLGDKVVWKDGVGTEISESMAYRKNKTCFQVDLKVENMTDDENTFMCMAVDKSAEVYYAHKMSTADAKMETAETMKTQFVANVTHELRTPVNGIQGNVQSLIREETNSSKLNTLKLIERGCKDMHSIINNILDYSKLSAGKMELDPKEFVFRDMMEYIRSTHINKISEKGLNFFMNISPEVPEKVIGDELRLGQVLNNFLSNATKFTSIGKIMVEVVKTAQRGNDIELLFMVMDTGIGISKENQEKLFKSFSQVEASTYRRYGGTGLGLNISKQLVEIMGGNVHVESEVNKGSIFSFHVWLKVPSEGDSPVDNESITTYQFEMPTLEEEVNKEPIGQFGSDENIEEIKKKLSKLILCIEMGNWDKAEMFMEAVRQLTAQAPREIKSLSLRLKMAVQKGDYDKSIDAYDNFVAALENGGVE